MSKKYLYSLMVLLLITCRKEKKRKETYSDYLSAALNLNNYKIKAVKINDSITEIKGINRQFETSGKLINGKKVGWWKVNENNTNRSIHAQYIMIAKNKNFLNQYIAYENNKILKLGSKFYETKILKNKICYIFNMPSKSSDTILVNNFYYGFTQNDKNLVHPTRKGNSYYQEIIIPHNSKKIHGYFTEGKKRHFNLGANSIYTLDSIK